MSLPGFFEWIALAAILGLTGWLVSNSRQNFDLFMEYEGRVSAVEAGILHLQRACAERD